MIKYLPKLNSVVFEEVPDKVTVAVEITNCRGRCEGCHSPFLQRNIGDVLTKKDIDDLISENFGVNCFLFLGEGAPEDIDNLIDLASHIREKYQGRIATAIYSGRPEVEDEIYMAFDYVKVGPFISKFGPLNCRQTNQRFYKVMPSDEFNIETANLRGSAPNDGRKIELDKVIEREFCGKPYILLDQTHRFWEKGVDLNAVWV